MLLKTLLYTDWISWFMHFGIFFVLSRWSGLKWQWALILIFGIEVWEIVDWALQDPMVWWMRLDTWMDVLSGSAGVGVAEWEKRKA